MFFLIPLLFIAQCLAYMRCSLNVWIIYFGELEKLFSFLGCTMKTRIPLWFAFGIRAASFSTHLSILPCFLNFWMILHWLHFWKFFIWNNFRFMGSCKDNRSLCTLYPVSPFGYILYNYIGQYRIRKLIIGVTMCVILLSFYHMYVCGTTTTTVKAIKSSLSPQRSPYCYLFVVTPTYSPSLTVFNPWIPLISIHVILSFTIMLDKWSQTV